MKKHLLFLALFIVIHSLKGQDDSNKVWTFVQMKPRFKGDVFKYLSDSIKYPEPAIENGQYGTVFTSFVVEKDGSVDSVKVMRGVCTDLNNEAVRVISKMPKWTPGYQNGHAVRVAFILPVKFSLKDEKPSPGSHGKDTIIMAPVANEESSPPNTIQQGCDFLLQKRFREAYDKFNEAIKEMPDSERAFRGRGEIDITLLKDTMGALEDFNEAIKLNPKYAQAYRNRAVVEGWMKNYDAAMNDLNRAIELSPEFWKAYDDRGHCKLYLKDYQGAMQDFDKAIDLNANLAMAYMGRGNAEKHLQMYNLALADFDKALALDASLKELYNRNINSSPELKELKGYCIIGMEKRNGLYYIQAEIDGIPTEFIFDTGASTVSISIKEADYLRRKGVLTDEDKRGTMNMFDATGKVTNEDVVNLKSVKIGCKELHNVIATIVPTLNAPFLLGQSALSQFGKVSIDYSNLTLTFKAE